ncbi:unnamed protein product [Phytophthora fragariaefolia]|uniref:Unnamed protein product n=1 Tax=Phytophthora fragariaefolia TaxID=1490495 RepID=A0A9W6TKS3_9STRA|nr:unnamed protein product [Phytophthora fragariaefolia]
MPPHPRIKPSSKETTPQPVAEATTTDSASRVKKASPKKKQEPATATAPSVKPTRRTRFSKSKEVLRPGPYEEPATSESDTDTPNPDLISGDEDPTPDLTAPRAPSRTKENSPLRIPLRLSPLRWRKLRSPSRREPSNARKADDFLNSSDTHDPKGSAKTTPPAKAPQERSPTPEDGPDPVYYEESEPDQGREQGEVPTPTRRRSSLSNNA